MTRRSIFIALFTAIVSLVILAIGTSTAFAFRCGSRLVNVGDTKAEVLSKCGDPNFMDQSEETTNTMATSRTTKTGWARYRTTGEATSRTTLTETWTYNLGERKLMKILTFEGNVLKKIEDGPYGNGPSRW